MKIEFIQKLIDKITNKPSFSKLLLYKYEAFKQCDDINTIVLGSSHLANGFIAQNNEFNFAMPSQDLYYAYQLYKKLNNEKIKNIIIAFSVFTPGLNIIKTKCAQYCIPYKILFDIDYNNSLDAKEKNLYESEEKYIKEFKALNKKLKPIKNYRGNILRYPKTKFNKIKAQNRAMKHYKNNQREDSQIKYCKYILKEADKNNQKVYFILPPATKNYRNALPKVEDLFKCLYSLFDDYKNMQILNYFDSDLFDEKKDFTNEDHLNKNGALKLTQMIRSKINE